MSLTQQKNQAPHMDHGKFRATDRVLLQSPAAESCCRVLLQSPAAESCCRVLLQSPAAESCCRVLLQSPAAVLWYALLLLTHV
uniref:Uncharacterized protein n=1 Tax=Knipowitschia caucasica TaxID=637954 RepID=A0AAV2KLQ2_KNICA